MTVEEQKLRQLFKNSSDCYADTWMDIGVDMVQGEVIQAITEDVFVKIATAYASQQRTEGIELLKEVRERLILNVNEDGEPNCSVSELLSMWTRVSDYINSK